MIADDGLELLSEDECRHLLAGATFGRIGISIGALPAILPVNYAVIDGDIVFRTGEGTKLRAALDQVVVAFEVDQADSALDPGWSVLVIGTAHHWPTSTHPAEAQILLDASPLVRRDHLVQIHPEFISGRRVARGQHSGPKTLVRMTATADRGRHDDDDCSRNRSEVDRRRSDSAFSNGNAWRSGRDRGSPRPTRHSS